MPASESAPEERTPETTAVPRAVRGVSLWLLISIALLWGAILGIIWAQLTERDALILAFGYALLSGIVTSLVTYLFVLVEPGLFAVRRIRALLTISLTGFVPLSLIALVGHRNPLSIAVHLLGLAVAVTLYVLSLRRNARWLFAVALLVLFLASIPW